MFVRSGDERGRVHIHRVKNIKKTDKKLDITGMVFVCFSSAVRNETHLQVAVECGENLQLSAEQTAVLLLSVRNLADSLHKHHLKECQGAEPKECPEPEVPENGALACVTVSNKRYCKPLCNNGYDFAWLRTGRLYEECGNHTGNKWISQYIGGNKLAECKEASIQVSGAKTAYFPQDCLTTKSSSQLQGTIIEVFTTELKNQGVQGEPQYACLVCG
uniref:Si:ch1073-126c3.2 n=1 Tax=Dicentrarchus labrax TaxID=13489 RepID=A0A8C4EJF7_DICLA